MAKRVQKPTEEQKALILAYMEEHVDLANNQMKDAMLRRHMWNDIIYKLNSCGGTYKTKFQWQRYWNDTKLHTKTKLQKQNRMKHNVVCLSSFEKKIVNILQRGKTNFAIKKEPEEETLPLEFIESNEEIIDENEMDEDDDMVNVDESSLDIRLDILNNPLQDNDSNPGPSHSKYSEETLPDESSPQTSASRTHFLKRPKKLKQKRSLAEMIYEKTSKNEQCMDRIANSLEKIATLLESMNNKLCVEY